MRESAALRLFSSKRFFVGLVLHLVWVASSANASVFVLTNDNFTYTFEDADSAFGGVVPSEGISGYLIAAEPLDGCSPILSKNSNIITSTADSVFVLIQRGGCVFDTKVKNAQDAGYSAAIVFNDEPGFELITMSGRDSVDIVIPSVFITYDSGQQVLSLLSKFTLECYISPTFDNTAWSVMAVSFMSLLAVSAVLATFFFVRRHRLRHLGTLLLAREEAGMPAREVKALPICIFESGQSLGCATSETCAICLEDYQSGEKLRVLPCKHEFHVPCIDQWLTTRRPFCPVCKRDARNVEASEDSSPLLTGEAASETQEEVLDVDSPELDSMEDPIASGPAPETNSVNDDTTTTTTPLLVTIETAGSEPESNLHQPLLSSSNSSADASSSQNVNDSSENGARSS